MASQVSMDPARRRMSTNTNSRGVGGAAAKSSTDKVARMKRCGLLPFFTTEEGEPAEGKLISITSTTDSDLKRRSSFAPKDEDVLVPLKSDEKELASWVAEQGIGWSCRKGLKPESPNQDSFSVFCADDTFRLYAVYDGHGPCGHDVSEYARLELVKQFLGSKDRVANPGKAFKEAFAITQVYLEGLMKPDSDTCVDCSMSGTTCTMAYIDKKSDTLTVAHVGDSRSVLGKMRGGALVDLEELTIDHKPNLEAEKKRIESADPPGRVVFDGYYNHRVFATGGMYPGLNMSRALGDVVGHKEAGLSAVPDVKVIDLTGLRKDYDAILLLLCTDGVWEFIESKEAAQIAANYPKSQCQEAINDLVHKSWQRWMEDSDGEISDDITGILVHL